MLYPNTGINGISSCCAASQQRDERDRLLLLHHALRGRLGAGGAPGGLPCVMLFVVMLCVGAKRNGQAALSWEKPSSAAGSWLQLGGSHGCSLAEHPNTRAAVPRPALPPSTRAVQHLVQGADCAPKSSQIPFPSQRSTSTHRAHCLNCFCKPHSCSPHPLCRGTRKQKPAAEGQPHRGAFAQLEKQWRLCKHVSLIPNHPKLHSHLVLWLTPS